MAKMIRQHVNGGTDPREINLPFAPVVPVKTQEQLLLEAEIERLRGENESLRNRPVSRLSLKISEKGALSVYGMGRFPVTLYREQWEKLLAMGEEIKAFIQANQHRLKLKD